MFTEMLRPEDILFSLHGCAHTSSYGFEEFLRKTAQLGLNRHNGYVTHIALYDEE